METSQNLPSTDQPIEPQMVVDKTVKQAKYYPASKVCGDLDTVVPKSMEFEQKKFNEALKARMKTYGDVDRFVMDRLGYNRSAVTILSSDPKGAEPKLRTAYEIFCDAFKKEQVDALATAIWNFENTGNGIILADQTGVGKGRVAAGLMRYAIVHLKKQPMFLTEKHHLINDIFRDLVGIHFDAGVPSQIRNTRKVEKKDWDDKELKALIKKDIEEEEELRIDFTFDDEDFELSDLFKDDYIDLLEEVIEAYRIHMEQEEQEEEYFVPVPDSTYQSELKKKLEQGYYNVKPLTVAGKFLVKDMKGNILYENTEKVIKEAIEEGARKGRIHQAWKVIVLPYSQLKNPYEKGNKNLTVKAKFLQIMANDNILILDESHTAAGKMDAHGKSSNIGEMVRKMLKVCKDAVYISATFAKTPENMPLYVTKTSIREANISELWLQAAFKKGGIPLQEAVSAELVRLGQLLRREKLIKGKTEYYYANPDSDDSVERDRAMNQINKLDQIAELYKLVEKFGDETRAAVKRVLSQLPKEEKDKYKYTVNPKRFAFLLFNFFTLGLKINQLVEEAVAQMRSGRKVVVAISNTLESAFDNMKKDFINDIGYEVGDLVKNDFSMYMAYLIDYIPRITKKEKRYDDKGEPYYVTVVHRMKSSSDGIVNDIWDIVKDKYAEYITHIADQHVYVPISPIDEITHRIEKAGFSIAEITGRRRCLKFERDNFKEGKLDKREIKPTTEIIRAFNENRVDALIINQAGATGVSMHPVPNDVVFKKPEGGKLPTSLEPRDEIKPRTMLVCQMELDINKEVQKLGRISRTGEVYDPLYKYIVSAIPSESRLTAMMQKKLSSLMANVSSNKDQGSNLFQSDDFFAPDAVIPFNDTMEEMSRADDTVGNWQGIYDFTKRMYFVKYNTQNNFYKTFSKKLREHIAELIRLGTYAGAMQMKDYRAEVKQVVPFLIGKNNSYSGFGGHGFAEIADCRIWKEKNLEYDLEAKIQTYLSDGKDGEEGKVFSKVADYQAHMMKRATDRLDVINTRQAEDIVKRDTDIAAKQAEIEKLTERSKQKELLEKAVKIEQEVMDGNKEIEKLSAEVGVLAMQGKLEEMQKVVADIQAKRDAVEAIRKQLDAAEIKDALAAKNDIENALGTIRGLQNDIERIEKSKAQEAKWHKEEVEAITLFTRYLQELGNVFTLAEYEEGSEDAYNEDGSYNYKYTYSKISETPVALVGVRFSGSQFSDWNMGKMELKLASPTELIGVTVNMLHGAHGVEATKRGKQNTKELTPHNVNYRGNWNEIMAKTDTSHVEERVILTGSLLKLYTTVSGLYRGQVIKYNAVDPMTKELKVRTGIELAKEPADILKKMIFAEDGKIALYEVFFDVNRENFSKLILETIERFKNEGVYNAKKDEYEPYVAHDHIDAYSRWNNKYGGLINQIVTGEPTKGATIMRTVEVDGEMVVQIHAEKPAHTDYFTKFLKQIKAEYKYFKHDYKEYQSKWDPEKTIEYKATPELRSWTHRVSGTAFFNTPETKAEFMRHGFEVNFTIQMDLNTFYSLLDHMSALNQMPTSVISNQIVEWYRDFYVFEQINDEVAGSDVSATGSVIDMSLDELLDELVTFLKSA